MLLLCTVKYFTYVCILYVDCLCTQWRLGVGVMWVSCGIQWKGFFVGFMTEFNGRQCFDDVCLGAGGGEGGGVYFSSGQDFYSYP